MKNENYSYYERSKIHSSFFILHWLRRAKGSSFILLFFVDGFETLNLVHVVLA